MTFSNSKRLAEADLDEALRLVSLESYRGARLARFAFERLKKAYQDEIDRLNEELETVRFQERSTVQPAPTGPDLAPLLQASIDQLERKKA